MPSSNGSNHDDRLYNIAEDYKRRGYKVTVSPAAKRLPKFLSTFAPDLVAKGLKESVVVEVKSPGRLRGAEYWEQLYSAVRQHPGWRVELVIDNVQDKARPKTISEAQIEDRLEEGRKLAQQGMLAASLLISVAAAEAAMRLACRKHEVELPDLRPETLVSRLYSDGLLARKEYELLMDTIRVRDAVAHGFHSGRISLSLINRLHRLARRLLQ